MKRGGFLLGCVILVCGLIWSNLALAKPPAGAACPPSKDCKELVVLAKGAILGTPNCLECYRKCTEKGCDDIIIRIKSNGDLFPKETSCDEALSCIPPDSLIETDLTYHIRRIGPCGTPVGTHEGKFKITSPTAGGVVATGKMKGTNGLETHVTSQECCAWPHDEGCMESKNVKCPDSTCKLMATYASTLPQMPNDPNEEELCDPAKWIGHTLFIDGILLCECEED
ncbi:MAG TPA: hypothetical protein ACFYD6_04600 [Candidatus Brocadiia bacterium]|nr:hypothetical protein [Planctomycetota bacterium]MDO8092848.1 hypothetical protein [Candidatus Brocadiales bacterium]